MGTFSYETVARIVRECYQRLAERAPGSPALVIFTERFARERLKAAAQAQGVAEKEVPEVLFVCANNAGRSVMAAALVERLAGGRAHVRSAGSDPTNEIHATVVTVMAEAGVDVSSEFPKPLSDQVVAAADVVVTMGCGDACPVYPGKRYVDWAVDDPAGRSVEEVRRIREDIDQRVRALLAELVGGSKAVSGGR